MINDYNNQNGYNVNSGRNTMTLNAPVDNTKITRLLLMPSRTDYRTPYKRSFDIDANYNNIFTFQNNILKQKGFNGNITSIDVSATIPNCITLQDRPIAAANIINGWGTHRLRFLMEVTSNINGSLYITYIQGYSEYYDPGSTVKVDPNMKFFINSVLAVRKTYDNVSGRYLAIPIAAYNVIIGENGISRYQYDGSQIPKTSERLIRPKDVMENLLTNSYLQNDMHINTAGALSASLQTSKRTNNDPTEYLSNTLNGYISSMNVATMSTDGNDIYRNATKTPFSLEPTIHSIPFIVKLSALTGILDPVYFTMNDLLMLDPNCNNSNIITLIANDSKPIITNLSPIIGSGVTEDTLNPTIETMIASTVNNVITSIMMKNMITRLSVSFGNRTGQNEAFISDINSFVTDMDPVFYGNRVISNINVNLIPIISRGNQLLVEVMVMCDILRDCSIVVDIGNGPMLFRFPTFADSLYTPMIGNEATTSDMVSGIETFVSAVVDYSIM